MSEAPPKGGYYSVIARAVARLDSNTHGSRQTLYEHARASQLRNISTSFTQPEVKREREALEQAIRMVEAEALVAEKEQADRDSKIIFDFSDFCGKTTTRPDHFYDVSVLPHPKATIIAAIERQIVFSPLDAYVEWLQSGVQFLMNFLEGIGSEPLSFKGGPAQRAASQAIQAIKGNTSAERDELRRIVSSEEYKRDMDRLSYFFAIAERENERLEKRIANALRARITRLAALSPTEKMTLDEQERKFKEFWKNSR